MPARSRRYEALKKSYGPAGRWKRERRNHGRRKFERNPAKIFQGFPEEKMYDIFFAFHLFFSVGVKNYKKASEICLYNDDADFAYAAIDTYATRVYNRMQNTVL